MSETYPYSWEWLGGNFRKRRGFLPPSYERDKSCLRCLYSTAWTSAARRACPGGWLQVTCQKVMTGNILHESSSSLIYHYFWQGHRESQRPRVKYMWWKIILFLLHWRIGPRGSFRIFLSSRNTEVDWVSVSVCKAIAKTRKHLAYPLSWFAYVFVKW